MTSHNILFKFGFTLSRRKPSATLGFCATHEVSQRLKYMEEVFMGETSVHVNGSGTTEESVNGTNLRQKLQEIHDQATEYFNRVASQANDESSPLSREEIWSSVSPEDQQLAEKLSTRIRQTVTIISKATMLSPLVGQAGQASLGIAMKSMTAALRFRYYNHWGPEVVSDEGTVLAVHPAVEREDGVIEEVTIARDIFADNCDKVLGFVDLVAVPKPSTQTSKE
ncbi:MAG: hypothetical protein IH935_11880, partial [Acidobacteria bacterium]|nr:hypothetical protein [Acidobacteriota bacterium]